MGYDHFALLATVGPLKEEEYEALAKACKKVRDEQKAEGGLLFGEVHHLSAGCFTEWWFEQFNAYIRGLYAECPHAEALYLYVCTFDGEDLARCEYFEGAPKGEPKEIKLAASDPRVRPYWDIDKLEVDNNITILCNEDYGFEYTPADRPADESRG